MANSIPIHHNRLKKSLQNHDDQQPIPVPMPLATLVLGDVAGSLYRIPKGQSNIRPVQYHIIEHSNERPIILFPLLHPVFAQHNFAKKKLIRFYRRVFAQLAKKWYSAT